MNTEGRASTINGFLQAHRMAVDEGFVSRFNMSAMYEQVAELCPTFLRIVHAFSTTARQLRTMTAHALSRKQTVS